MKTFDPFSKHVTLSDADSLEQHEPLPDVLKGKWYFGFHTFILSSEGLKYRYWGSFQNTLELTKQLAEEMVAQNV